MSAKKYLTISLLATLLANISTIFAQNEAENDLSIISKEANPQFLIRTERDGKTKYVGCALPNLYFHKATSATPEEESLLPESEFTAKGGSDSIVEYYGYTFFLVQDKIIKACNETGNFKDQPDGLYTLSGFSHPLSLSPESFIGQEFATVTNHPFFEKDAALYNITIRILAPKKTEPVLSTEPTAAEENTLGQVQVLSNQFD